MCELVTPPMILAIPVPTALCQTFRQPVSLGQQLRLELFRGNALKRGAGVLHGRPARNRHLRHVINVRACAQHAQEVLLQDEILVLAGDAELVAVRRRIPIELLAILFVIEREQQLVERICVVRMLPVNT
jgi:hypothetical protein